MKYIRNIAMVSIMVVVVACFPKVKHGNASYGGSLVIAALSGIADLNPLLYIRSDATCVGWLLYSGLVKLNEKEEPVPDIAERWEISEGGLAFTFFLRRGVLFHDGVECTAEDVVFTFDTIKNPEVDSPLRTTYDVIDSVEAVDPYTVRIRLNKICPSIFILLLKEIVPKHLFAEEDIRHCDFNEKPVGTGPYLLKKRNSHEVVLEANGDYFGGRPYIDRVIFSVFPDKQMAWTALMQGKVDVIDDLDREDYRIIEADSRFNGHFYYGTFCYALVFNLRDPVLSDIRVREAICRSVNKADLIETALGGWGIPANGPFNPSSWSCNKDIPSREYDPAEAAGIIKTLGFTISMHIVTSEGYTDLEAVAKRLKWQLYQTGILSEVEIVPLENLFVERVYPGDFQAAIIPLNTAGDPDKWTTFFWHSKNSDGGRRTNYSYFRNSEVDALIEKSNITATIEDRKAIYMKIGTLLAEERPALFLFFRKQVTGMSSRVGGVPEYAGSFYWSVKDWYLVNHES
ncbi:MAG: hypothetical protein JW881_20435 [Spirochaetales bacterium]|nr:hypothetical protein [Spirochaetales bacterium]